MYGVSTMGSTVCFYKYDKDRPELGITPTVHANQTCGNDTTPRELWNYDLLDKEGVGERKMREVVADVLDACVKLPNLEFDFDSASDVSDEDED